MRSASFRSPNTVRAPESHPAACRPELLGSRLTVAGSLPRSALQAARRQAGSCDLISRVARHLCEQPDRAGMSVCTGTAGERWRQRNQYRTGDFESLSANDSPCKSLKNSVLDGNSWCLRGAEILMRSQTTSSRIVLSLRRILRCLSEEFCSPLVRAETHRTEYTAHRRV